MTMNSIPINALQERYLQPHQARQRPPTTFEDLLGDSIERAFAMGIHDLEGLVSYLNSAGPSGPNGLYGMVAPALMDVAGPRTSIRPVAGLPLLNVEHPELTGGRQLVKSLFDTQQLLTAPGIVDIRTVDGDDACSTLFFDEHPFITHGFFLLVVRVRARRRSRPLHLA